MSPSDPAGPDPSEVDPTRMRDQPALRTSTGRGWLVIGAVSAVLLVTMFTLLLAIAPGLATIGIVTVVASLVMMLVARMAAPHGPARLRALAVLYVAMLGASLVLSVAIVVAPVP